MTVWFTTTTDRYVQADLEDIAGRLKPLRGRVYEVVIHREMVARDASNPDTLNNNHWS